MDNPSFGDSPTVQSLLEKIASSALEPYAVRVAREQAARQGGATEQPGGPLDASSPGRGPGGVMRPISPTWQGRASASPAVKPETPGDEFAAFLHDHSVNSSTASGKQVEEDDDDHDDDERDDLARLPAAPKPSPRALRGALAEQGDVAGVYDVILHDRWDSHTYAEAFKDLAKAIDVASHKDSSQFSAEIFRIVLNFSICCTLRAQLALLQGMQADDRQPCRRSFEIASTSLEDFQKHVSSMQRMSSSCAKAKRRRPGCGNSHGKNSAKTITGNLRADGIALCPESDCAAEDQRRRMDIVRPSRKMGVAQTVALPRWMTPALRAEQRHDRGGCRHATALRVEDRWREVKQRILAVSEHLWTQGSICRKWDRGGWVWRLRFYERLPDGRRVQRTVRIGCDLVLVERAQDLLRRCRERQASLEEIPMLARLVTAAAAAGRRLAGESCRTDLGHIA